VYISFTATAKRTAMHVAIFNQIVILASEDIDHDGNMSSGKWIPLLSSLLRKIREPIIIV
jgi:hypothetical protein